MRVLRNSFLAIVFSACVLLGAAPSSGLPRDSMYNLDATFIDDTGARVQLGSLQGAPAVLTFVYTRCKSACPLTVERLRRLRAIIAPKSPSTSFVLISFDAEHDSPEALREFRKSRKLEGPHWILLTGKAPDIRALSVLLGYSYQNTGSEENPIAHSNRLVLLDSRGVILATLDGLNSDVSEFAAKLPR